MKQLSALGVRRQFYRNPRRLRALRPGDELDTADLLAQHAPFNYFVGMYVAATHASTTGVNPAGDAGDTSPPNILVGGHTHTHPFNGPLSGTTQVSRYQKGKNQSGFY